MGLLDQYNALSDNAQQYVLNKLARFGNVVGNTVQAIPVNANRLAQGLLNLPQTAKNDIGGLLGPQMNKLAQQTYQPTPSSLITNPPQQANPQQWMDKGLALAGMAPVMGLLGHTVYHGSPHKFDAFDMSKIGTGEGAQAYGHGLYFAESPKVAEGYATALNPNAVVARANTDASGTAQRVLEAVGFNREKAINELTNRKQMSHVLNDQEWQQKMDDAISYIKGVGGNTSSNMYKVDIPDETIPRMLDWDKPISEQPDILAALKNAGYGRTDTPGVTGGYYAPKTQAEINNLLEAGIPGIRYLDATSRNADKGTSNFVLFDDALARILEVNGQPTGLKPWNAK